MTNQRILSAACRKVIRRTRNPQLLLEMALEGNVLAKQHWHTEVRHEYRKMAP